MVQNRAVDEAVINVTEAIRNAADAAIPRTSNSPRKLCGQLDWQTFASVSARFIWPCIRATKNRLERTHISFRCRQPLPYNCDFDMFELKRAYHRPTILVQVLWNFLYELRHFPSEREGFTGKVSYRFNRICEGDAGVSYSMARSHSDPHFKTWKILRTLSAIDPIALTSCLVRHWNVWSTLVSFYELERTNAFPLFQSGFRKGRSTFSTILLR
ncbi:hypothetical protein TNCV_685641 [Trichonephila clavipes]|nr:hypothetical protein TNCV_685641 [Trichonephila clavipes]